MKTAVQYIKENDIQNIDVSDPQTMIICSRCGRFSAIHQTFVDDSGSFYCSICAKEIDSNAKTAI